MEIRSIWAESTNRRVVYDFKILSGFVGDIEVAGYTYINNKIGIDIWLNDRYYSIARSVPPGDPIPDTAVLHLIEWYAQFKPYDNLANVAEVTLNI